MKLLIWGPATKKPSIRLSRGAWPKAKSGKWVAPMLLANPFKCITWLISFTSKSCSNNCQVLNLSYFCPSRMKELCHGAGCGPLALATLVQFGRPVPGAGHRLGTSLENPADPSDCGNTSGTTEANLGGSEQGAPVPPCVWIQGGFLREESPPT